MIRPSTELRTIRITVPIDPHETALNQRLHWRERAKRNARAREIARLAWLAAGGLRVNGKVRVSVIIRRAREEDPFNLPIGLKPLVDGIFHEGVTIDDSARWIQLGDITQETGKQHKGREEVEFVIEEVGTDPAA